MVIVKYNKGEDDEKKTRTNLTLTVILHVTATTVWKIDGGCQWVSQWVNEWRLLLFYAQAVDENDYDDDDDDDYTDDDVTFYYYYDCVATC